MLSTYWLWIRALCSGGFKGHFGQYAEDVIARKYFAGRERPGRYIDIGAYHPFRFSNTAHFYLSGWRGINVDANPNTIKLLQKYRPEDRNLWFAVIPEARYQSGETQVQLHIPDEGQAKGVSARGFIENTAQLADPADAVVRSMLVPATSIRAILESEDVRHVDLLNIDVEGMDALILEEFDFRLCRPTLVIIEDFSPNFEALMSSDTTVKLTDEGYRLMARMGWSSIFALE